jgi:hypothetical protein
MLLGMFPSVSFRLQMEKAPALRALRPERTAMHMSIRRTNGRTTIRVQIGELAITVVFPV